METLTTNDQKQVSTFGEYSIVKDFSKKTVLITKPSPRARLGIKIVHHYSFNYTDLSKSILNMNLFVDKFINAKEKEAIERENKKRALSNARKNFTNPFQVGQIFYNSYGYEQTNVSFYQITEIKGKKVILHEVVQHRTYSHSMAGSTLPVKNDFIGKPIEKIIQLRARGPETIDAFLKDLLVWDGQPKYWSSYA